VHVSTLKIYLGRPPVFLDLSYKKTFPITVHNFGEIGRRSLNILWQNKNESKNVQKSMRSKTI